MNFTQGFRQWAENAIVWLLGEEQNLLQRLTVLEEASKAQKFTNSEFQASIGSLQTKDVTMSDAIETLKAAAKRAEDKIDGIVPVVVGLRDTVKKLQDQIANQTDPSPELIQLAADLNKHCDDADAALNPPVPTPDPAPAPDPTPSTPDSPNP